MSEVRELYQELIVEHSRKPRNFGKLEGADQEAKGFNPLCGDKVTFYLKMAGNVVREVSWTGAGCAISTSSASLLSERLKGKTRTEAEALFELFHRLVTDGSVSESELADL